MAKAAKETGVDRPQKRGFSCNRGNLITGWFVSWKIPSRRGWFRSTPISGNHQNGWCWLIPCKASYALSTRPKKARSDCHGISMIILRDVAQTFPVVIPRNRLSNACPRSNNYTERCNIGTTYLDIIYIYMYTYIYIHLHREVRRYAWSDLHSHINDTMTH